MESGATWLAAAGSWRLTSPAATLALYSSAPRRGPRPAPLMAVAALPGVVPRTSGTLTGAGPLAHEVGDDGERCDLAGRGVTLAADEPGSHAGAVLVGSPEGTEAPRR